jgi:hypothetical protein
MTNGGEWRHFRDREREPAPVRPADPAEISRRSERDLRRDKVRPGQAQSYLDLFRDDRWFLRDLWAQYNNDRADMERAALGHAYRDSTAERSQLAHRWAHLPKSHQWLRGIVTPALILDDLGIPRTPRTGDAT